MLELIFGIPLAVIGGTYLGRMAMRRVWRLDLPYAKAIEEAKGVDLSNTLDQIETEIAYLKSVLAEIDDEETLLLLI